MSYVIPALAAGVLAVAAVGDIRRRRIPNVLPAALVALGVARLSIEADLAAALYTGAAAAAVFGVGILLFRRGLIGGGDVKLTGGTVLLLGHHAVPGFLLAMSFCGLAVTLMILIAARVAPFFPAAAPTPAIAAAARPTIPYGVAIAAAGILIFLLQPPS